VARDRPPLGGRAARIPLADALCERGGVLRVILGSTFRGPLAGAGACIGIGKTLPLRAVERRLFDQEPLS
jgi:hypothetical protein